MSNLKSHGAAQPAGPSLPWWRVRMVWLVIAGPATVVVAGFVTLFIAMDGADPVLRVQPRAAGAAPAVQARNHAATGVRPAQGRGDDSPR